MTRVENFLNILHYSFYLITCKLDFISNKVNPLAYMYKIPFVKRRQEELGVNLNDEVDKAFNDKNFGIGIINAGGFIFALLFILFIDVILIIGNLNGANLNLNFLHFGGVIIISYSICYFFIFKKGKYLKHINKFEAWTKQEKRKYVILSLIFSLMVISLFFIILIFL